MNNFVKYKLTCKSHEMHTCIKFSIVTEIYFARVMLINITLDKYLPRFKMRNFKICKFTRTFTKYPDLTSIFYRISVNVNKRYGS